MAFVIFETVNEIILSIYDELLAICKAATDNHELTEDLRQEVVLALYNKTEEELTEIYNAGRLGTYAAMIAYRKWYFRNGSQFDGQKNTSCFRYVYRDFNFIASVDLEDVKNLLDYEDFNNEQHVKELYKELTAHLEPLERDILREYVNRNCKVSQLAKDAGVSRRHLQKRMDFIKEKIKEKCRK